jgi:integrase/recombinase XerD
MAAFIHANECFMENDEADDYLRFIRDRVASSTYHGKRRLLTRYLRWLDDNKLHLSTIQKSHVERFLHSLKSSFIRADMLYLLRCFYDYLKQSTNPCDEIQVKTTYERRLIHVPSQGAIEKILSALAHHEGPTAERNRVMVELAYGSALRVSEIVALDVEDVDLQKRTAIINGKGSKVRVVPLTKTCASVLQSYLLQLGASRGPLFLSRVTGRRLVTYAVSRVFREHTGYNTHRFRHACASHLLQNGCGIRYIQELLGHEKISTTDIYTHLNKNDLAKIIESKHPRPQNIHP